MEIVSQVSFTQVFEAAGGFVGPHVCLCVPAGCERGVFIHKLRVSTVAPVSEPDAMPLVYIPASLVLTAAEAAKSEVVCRCCDKLPDTDASESVVLALFLLTERARGADSPWEWYINALPCVGTNALYFENADIAALQGTPLGSAAEAKLRQLKRQYGCFAETLDCWQCSQNLELTLSFEDYKWASFIVLSRSISLHSCDESVVDCDSNGYPHGRCDRALIPFLDMFNHCARPNAYWTVNSNGSVSIHAAAASTERSDINSDQPSSIELCLSYGAKPATEWAYEYGFLPLDNRHDAWPHFVQLAGSPSLVAIKRMWIQELGLSPRVMLVDPAATMPIHSSDRGYLSRSALLMLCLAALDDLSDKCTHAVGKILPAMPYFSVGGAIVDDDEKLLQLPGLATFARHKCSSQLSAQAFNMRASSYHTSPKPNPLVLAYLETQSSLVDRIADYLTDHLI
ncbi:SET domain-containing protein [Coemansia reversa NRRL 1564]|uniref:SET domain-containing protein n=1 Tax=Coemansia reversa (strain ATCC 12441 / NRRL 1564) TaxID=763665 RepID=A0A2G5BEE3_COERN|nr:SET domain-containing protein [Coemansia reversa NRRL 1564]|eukprot:PIA17374.1 SET domain-containing protein [Coemansia reversa NRRL 1564]